MPDTPLLAPEFLARLGRLELVSRKAFAGRLPGERLGPRKGQSVEFADHRGYAVGDDLRFLDWGLLARLDRLFVKLYRAEEDLHVHLLIDASASMGFGEPTKLSAACRAAAAVGYIALAGLDRVTVRALGDAGRHRPLRGRHSFARLAGHLGGLKPEGPGDLRAALRAFSLAGTGRGVVVLVSDFLDKGGYAEGMRFLAARQFDVIVIQVLAREELDPGLAGDLRLVDCEDADAAEVTADAELMRSYRANLEAFRSGLAGHCGRRGWTYLLLANDEPFERLVLTALRERGRLQ
jgi:uncharacterized protein (DUF58 family)